MAKESGVAIFKKADALVAQSFLNDKIDEHFDAIKFGPVDIVTVLEQYPPGSHNFETAPNETYHVVVWWNKG